MKPPRFAAALLRWCTPAADREFIQQDLAEEFERLCRDGSPAAARRWYRRQVLGSIGPLSIQRFGSVHAPQPSPAGSITDAGQALRSVVRHPGLSLTVVGTLLVGMTTTLAAALLVHRVILQPLPYEASEQLVVVYPAGPRLPASVRSVSLPDFEDWQRPAEGIAGLSGFSSLTYTLTGAGDPRRVEGLRVGRGFAELLRTPPVLGRAFADADYREGAQYVALIRQSMWQRDFGGEANVIGRSLTLDDRRYEIVGVLPDVAFEDLSEPHEFWVPLVARPGVTWEPVRGNGFIAVVARLAPGATLEAAQGQLSALATRLAEQYPRSNAERPSVRLEPLHGTLVRPVKQPLLLILGAVAAVLLVACGNLLNLLLASSERRAREFAVRRALGAEAGRLRRQVLFEVGACVTAAAVISVGLAPWLARLFTVLYPTPIPSTADLHLTMPVVGIALTFAAAVTMLLAAPQLRQAGAAPLRGPRTTGDRRDRRGRAVLIAVQVTFTIVLTFAGVALARSIARLSAVEPGFDPGGVVAISVTPSAARYPSAGATRVFYQRLLEDIRGIPGVRGAAVSTAIPFVNLGWSFSIAPPEGGTPRMVRVTVASPGFFETLGARLVRGRLLTDDEHTSGQRSVVINEHTARLLPYDDPVGRVFRYSGIDWTIVGVTAPVVQVGLRTPAAAELFLPWSQAGRAPQRLVVDLDTDPSALLPVIAARVHALDPAAPVADVMRLQDRIDRSVAADRFAARLLTALAMIAVLLAALGSWSVTAVVVARGTRENGIRAALGEARVSQLRRTVGRTLRPALTGLTAGLLVCLWVAPAMSGWLFGMSPRDPLTAAVAAAAVLVTIVIATLAPAVRGLRADPAAALRAD